MTVRTILQDPQYSAWFLPFGPNKTMNGSYWSPPCDPNYSPPLCSSLYHDSICQPGEAAACQVPGYPSGDGVCAPPACDVGSVPIGEYLWDPRGAVTLPFLPVPICPPTVSSAHLTRPRLTALLQRGTCLSTGKPCEIGGLGPVGARLWWCLPLKTL